MRRGQYLYEGGYWGDLGTRKTYKGWYLDGGMVTAQTEHLHRASLTRRSRVGRTREKETDAQCLVPRARTASRRRSGGQLTCTCRSESPSKRNVEAGSRRGAGRGRLAKRDGGGGSRQRKKPGHWQAGGVESLPALWLGGMAESQWRDPSLWAWLWLWTLNAAGARESLRSSRRPVWGLEAGAAAVVITCAGRTLGRDLGTRVAAPEERGSGDERLARASERD